MADAALMWQGGLARAARTIVVPVRQLVFVDPRADDAEAVLRWYRSQMTRDKEATKRLMGVLQCEAEMAQMNKEGVGRAKANPTSELQVAVTAPLPGPLVKPDPPAAEISQGRQPPETPF